jgi:hypothetical protein
MGERRGQLNKDVKDRLAKAGLFWGGTLVRRRLAMQYARIYIVRGSSDGERIRVANGRKDEISIFSRRRCSRENQNVQNKSSYWAKGVSWVLVEGFSAHICRTVDDFDHR